MKTTNPHPYRVLLADDQADIRDALRLLLKREGYETKAVGKQSAACHSKNANRFAPGAEAGIKARSRKPHPTRRIASDIPDEISSDGSRAGVDRSDWTVGRERFDYRGAWHWKRSCRKNPSRVVHTRDEANGDCERGRAVRGRFRKRTVRPCQRGLHRCAR